MKLILPEETKIIQALAPAADAAGRVGLYVSLKNAARAYIIASIAQGNAAPVPLTINQAQDVAGTGAKAITNLVANWEDLDTSITDALVRGVDAVGFTTDAGLKNKVVVFQVDARSLDAINGFNTIAIVTGPSNVANITSAMYILTDLRFDQATPPSAIVN